MPGTQPQSIRATTALADTPEALAAALTAERARLKQANQAAPQGLRACRALTEACDLTIQRMLSLSLPQDPSAREAVRRKFAVIATGGYGRAELCPFSDIDVTFVVADEEDAALDATVRQMFMNLMEVFGQRVGLKVGYGYRTLSDVERLDHQTQTALLDARVIAGSHALFNEFALGLFRHLWPAAFVRRKVAERRRVVEKQGATLYRIEPEVREGPGGLRDLHLAEWLAAASFPTTRGDVWPQLQRQGVVTRPDAQQMEEAREFLLTVRTWMHWEADRAADTLVRERQEGLAEALRHQDDECASRVERFMERYYQHAENVDRVTAFVIERCLGERLSLTDELVCVGNDLVPAYPWIGVASPRFLVEICQHYQDHGLLPGYELRRMIAQHLSGCSDLSTDTQAAEDFTGLLRAAPPTGQEAGPTVPQPGTVPGGRPGVYDTLALMAQIGILQCLIPEIGEAYRRVPFDQVHRHTVGYHSLQAVRSLERLRTTPDEKLQEFRRIWSEVAAPELLFLATLLHDTGKLAPGADWVHPLAGGQKPSPHHSEAGAQMAASICRRLHLDPPAAAAVEALVRHHLLMSETAQLRDLTLDKTIQDFTRVVDSRDVLNMLMLLTYADMEATGVMSPMKARFLEDLYFRADAVLSSGRPAEDPSDDRQRRVKSRLTRQLATTSLTPEQIREHTEGMPLSYLFNTPAPQIALHIRMVDALRNNGPVVEFDNELGADVTMVHVCTLERPQPGLLSQIAGVLYAHEVAVHGAQVCTRRGDPAIALDTLWVDYHGRGIPPFKRLELEQDLCSTLKGGDVEATIARCRKQLPPPIPPRRVRIDNQAAEHHTVVEILADDQPALLYRITRSMAQLGWNIHSARITTVGDRARDAFYVTGPGGGKLQENRDALEAAFMKEFCR